MSRAKKADRNQPQIVKALRDIPFFSVAHTHMVGSGFPDISIGYRGVTFLAEIKDTGKREQLTPAEIKFRDSWTGNYMVIETAEEAINVINNYFKRRK